MYAIALVTAFAFRAAGVFDIAIGEGLLICALGLASAALFGWTSREAARYRRWGGDASWLAVDVVLVTWGVAASGGLSSPWYLWYLANAGAAAFAAGRRGALLVSLGDVAAYLGLLAARGDIGLFDAPCFLALARMAFLHGAAFFFVRGVADLSRRRMEIRKLRDEDARRVADLERLAAALDQRTRELTLANARIREADRQKSRFLANVSHELRTPLNSILGFSQVLSTRFAETLPEKPARFVRHIHTSGEHLLKVLDDVLDLSKIEAGRMTLAPLRVDPAAAVEEAAAAAQGEATPRGIAVGTEAAAGLPRVDADPLKLRQILLNLVANAIHYSADGAPVTVGAAFLAASDSPLGVDSVRFFVRDQGTGIDAEDQATIFDEFRQARRRARGGGTGLGLALVKSLAGLHGGTVGLTSAPGRGSTFRVDLPVRFRGERESRREESSSGNHPVIESPRVLVVGEAPFDALQEALGRAGCLVVTSRPGDDAFRLAHTLHPAALAVVLDDPDSWRLLCRLDADSSTHDIPVVLVAPAPGGAGAALAADELRFQPVPPETWATPGPALVWARDGARRDGATVVSSIAAARQACAAEPPRLAVLEISADPDVVGLAAELSRGAAATGSPVLRLHASVADYDRVSERLAALPSPGADANASLVVAVAMRALARAATAP